MSYDPPLIFTESQNRVEWLRQFACLVKMPVVSKW